MVATEVNSVGIPTVQTAAPAAEIPAASAQIQTANTTTTTETASSTDQSQATADTPLRIANEGTYAAYIAMKTYNEQAGTGPEQTQSGTQQDGSEAADNPTQMSIGVHGVVRPINNTSQDSSNAEAEQNESNSHMSDYMSAVLENVRENRVTTTSGQQQTQNGNSDGTRIEIKQVAGPKKSEDTDQRTGPTAKEESQPQTTEPVLARYTPDMQAKEDHAVLKEGIPKEPAPPAQPSTPYELSGKYGPKYPGKDASSREIDAYEESLEKFPNAKRDYERYQRQQREYEAARIEYEGKIARYNDAHNRFSSATILTEQQKNDLEAGKTVSGDDRLEPERIEYLTSMLKYVAADKDGKTDGNSDDNSSIDNLEKFASIRPEYKRYVGQAMYLVSSEQVVTSDGKRGSIDNIPTGVRNLLTVTRTDENGCHDAPKKLDNYDTFPLIQEQKLARQYRVVTSILGSADQRYRNSSELNKLLIERAAELSTYNQNLRDNTAYIDPTQAFDNTIKMMLSVGGTDERSTVEAFADDTTGTRVIQPLLNYRWNGQDNSLTVAQRIAREENPKLKRILEEAVSDNSVLANSKTANPDFGMNRIIEQLGVNPDDPRTQKAINNLVHKSGDRSQWVHNPGVQQTLAATMHSYWPDLAGQNDYPHLDQFTNHKQYIDFTASLMSDPLAANTVTNSFRYHRRNIAYTYGATNGEHGDGLVYGVLEKVIEEASVQAFDDDFDRRTFAAAQEQSNQAQTYERISGAILAVAGGTPLVGTTLATLGYYFNPDARYRFLGSSTTIAPDVTKEGLIIRIQEEHLPGVEKIAIAQGIGGGNGTQKERDAWKKLNNPTLSLNERSAAAEAWFEEVCADADEFRARINDGKIRPGIRSSAGLPR